MYSFSYNNSDEFFIGDVFLSRRHGSLHARGKCCVSSFRPPLLGGKHGLTILGFLAHGADCAYVHLARLIAGVQRAGLDVHDISLASGSPDVFDFEVSPANACCSGTRKRIARIRSVAQTVSSRRCIGGRAMELVNGHASFLAPSNRGALSILASFKFARASYLVSGKPWSTVRMEQRSFGVVLCLLRSDWSLRWLDVCICTETSEKGFAFALREGCRELASEVCRVSERTTFKRSSMSIRARTRGQRSIAPDVVLECSSSDEDVMSLAWEESRADFPEVSVQLQDPSKWNLTAYSSFFREENIMVLEMPPGMRRVDIHRDASQFFLTILRRCWRSAKDAQTIFHCFQSCVESLRLASGQVLSYRSGGYRSSKFVPRRKVLSLTVIMT